MQVASVAAVLEREGPRYIFHLGGHAEAVAAAEGLAAALRNHACATAILLEAVQRVRLEATVLIPGSSAQFGNPPRPQRPITETVPYRPVSLYGVAKTAEAMTADYWGRTHGLAVIRTNTFNCIGPGQRDSFVPATFARQIAAIEKGLAEPILHVGNLVARRDVIDVRDVAKAYVAAVTRGVPGAVYNVCSGRAPSVAELIDGLCRHTRVELELHHDPSRLRPDDIPVQIGDASALKRASGWRPAIPLDTSLADVLDDWRARI
jgi:GDP-4-dehydro-6-deoxy-D-mannose reductase